MTCPSYNEFEIVQTVFKSLQYAIFFVFTEEIHSHTLACTHPITHISARTPKLADKIVDIIDTKTPLGVKYQTRTRTHCPFFFIRNRLHT